MLQFTFLNKLPWRICYRKNNLLKILFPILLEIRVGNSAKGRE